MSLQGVSGMRSATVFLVAGLVVRLESDQTVTDASGKVTTWTDQSGRNHPAIQSTGTGYTTPLLEQDKTLTGRAAIRFNPLGTTKECLDIGATTDLDMTSGITWYIVYQTKTTNENRRAIGAGYDDITGSGSTKSYLA